MPPVMSTLNNVSGAPAPPNTTTWSLLSHPDFITQMQTLGKSSPSDISTEEYENHRKDYNQIMPILSFLVTQKGPRAEILHQIAHWACLVLAKGHPVEAVIEYGMLAGQIKWVLLHPGRITFECKSLDESHQVQPTANPLVVSCLAEAIREWQVKLRDVHTKLNEQRIINGMHMEIYISRMQSAGKPIPPEVMARRTTPTVEGAGFTYAPELDRLVEMMKEVLEETVKEIEKQEGGDVPKEGCGGRCTKGACPGPWYGEEADA